MDLDILAKRVHELTEFKERVEASQNNDAPAITRTVRAEMAEMRLHIKELMEFKERAEALLHNMNVGEEQEEPQQEPQQEQEEPQQERPIVSTRPVVRRDK